MRIHNICFIREIRNIPILFDWGNQSTYLEPCFISYSGSKRKRPGTEFRSCGGSKRLYTYISFWHTYLSPLFQEPQTNPRWKPVSGSVSLTLFCRVDSSASTLQADPFPIEGMSGCLFFLNYSRTSIARTPMSRLPRLIRTRFWVPTKFFR